MNRENGKRSNFRPSTPKYLRFFATVSQLIRTPLRDQSVFITWGGPEEFRRGSLEIGLPKGGFTHLKILVDGGGGGGSKNTYTVHLYLQYLSLTLVNMILQKLDCIATKIQK